MRLILAAAAVASALLFAAQSSAPPTDRFVAKVLQSRYSRSAREGQRPGTGAAGMLSAIAQSRFVVVGEDHGLAQTPELAGAVCHAAGSARFPAMAIEKGQLAAGTLRREGPDQVAAFEKTFPESINVYNAREEFEMLQQCAGAAQGDFHLWGLNQEMLGAGGLVLSRILDSRLGETARPAMQQLLRKNDDALRKARQSGSI